MNRTLLLVIVGSVFPTIGLSQTSPRQVYESAVVAWQDGDYPRALDAFKQVLDLSDDASLLRDIALVTGELYRTTEVAPDGTAPGWSTNGRWLSYATPSDTPTETRIVRADDGEEVARLPGTGAVFGGDGSVVAYVALDAGEAWSRARATAREAVDASNRLGRFRLRQRYAEIDAEFTSVHVRSIDDGADRHLNTDGLAVYEIAFLGDVVYALAAPRASLGDTELHALGAEAPRRLTDDDRYKVGLRSLPGRPRLLWIADAGTFQLFDAEAQTVRTVLGEGPGVSDDGTTIAFVRLLAGEMSLNVLTARETPREILRVPFELRNPAPSPRGDRIVFEAMPREDWELMLAEADGSGLRRITTDIQHDLLPRFLDDDRIVAVKGEPRHRRSYVYDAATTDMARLFHNNTVRTVAPEYEWVPNPDGSRVLIVAERDGDTISPERGLYLVDLTTTIDEDELRARLEASLTAERTLRAWAHDAFAPIHSSVEAAVADVSISRIYRYEADLFAFGSKHIQQPGNAEAIVYLRDQLQQFGYEPELQWFEPRPGIRTANVIVTIPGTVDPDVRYVVSSHFDSVERGPGADDNTSGTAALLEIARVLAGRPQARTIVVAFFTGEEAGLLGSREFVRRAVANGDQIVGALNNDMIGFANDQRLDNTIRYSNAGIRDVQHGAAILFSDLITYDAKYYKGTDAVAYFEAYGDIVGGIGSYPILANPHYHQSHDVLETMNHRLIAEVSKTTTATLLFLTASPSRLTDLKLERVGDVVEARWNAAVESDVDRYEVAWEAGGTMRTVVVQAPVTRVEGVQPGTEVRVRAVSEAGMPGWDWARAVTPE